MKAVVVAVAALAFGQTPPPAIRVATRLVEVSVIARDRTGPVRGLTKDNFRLFDNGKEQKVALFTVNSVHELAKPEAPLAPGIFSNRPERRGEAPTNVTVVLLDGINTDIKDQGYARRQFLRMR